jgi:hypothetical protein
MGAGQAGAVGSLSAAKLKPQAKSDRGGVATAGES